MRLKVKTQVEALLETQALATEGEAAHDPAIFIHPQDPSLSLIISADQQNGLSVYNLAGNLQRKYPVGMISQVDIRTKIRMGNNAIHLVAASDPTKNTLLFFELDPKTGNLRNISGTPLVSEVNEIYGFCLYQNPTGKTYAFITGYDGQLEQWELQAKNDRISADLARRFYFGGPCKGLVADDELGYLYLAQERKGIWKLKADPDQTGEGILVDKFRFNSYIKKDLEGLAIYYAADGKGYLLASSQGNDSYAVYRREAPNYFLGSFKIGDGQLDGVSETNGIEVINLPAGDQFPMGFFIVQDAVNTNGEDFQYQNFKLVPWQDIAQKYRRPLLIDTTYHKLTDLGKGQEEVKVSAIQK